MEVQSAKYSSRKERRRVDLAPDLVSTDLPEEELDTNLSRVDEVLALVEQPLQRRRERKSFDQVVARLAQPQLLHHNNKRLRGLTLDCLEQVVRICQLENNAKADASASEEAHNPESGGDDAAKAIRGAERLKDSVKLKERAHEDEDDEEDDGADDADDEDDEEADDEGDGPAGNSGEPMSDEVEKLGIWCTAPGEMPRLIREKDWASTPLGPIAQWPNTLKIALAICLFTRFPFVIFWGREYRMLYNDAYRLIMGNKHPRYFGEPYAECWPTMWAEQNLDEVVKSSRANWFEDQFSPIDRHGYIEEVYFTSSYSPLFMDDGSVGGLFTIVSETTNRVIGERQLRAIRDLAASGAGASTAKDAVRITAQVIATTGKWDISFANIYLLDERAKRAILAETVGLEKGTLLCPQLVTLYRMKQSDSEDSRSEDDREEEQGGFWIPFFTDVVQKKSSQILDLEQFGGEVPPCSAWNESPRSCVILPMMSRTDAEKVVGILVAGVNPRHELDDNYKIFFNLFSGHVASIITTATAREEERKRAEALAELDRAKTIFFSNISHEFRTPLTLMLGPLEDLLDQAELQVEKEQLTLIHRNVLRLYKLVNSLLDFSRLEAGRARAVYEPVDLSTFTQDLASIFRSATERAGLELIVECAELEQPVYVDKDMWEKIVLNLLSNALKFTMHGHIRVVLSPQPEGQVELVVEDTGIGIPTEELPLLGKRFHRVQTPGGRSHEGTGIGLAMVFELVRLHGGTVSVESQLGHGATFRVRIPFGMEHLPSNQIKRIVRTIPPSFPSSAVTAAAKPAAITFTPIGIPPAELPDDGSSSFADARHYSKTASWWLPSIPIASSSSSGVSHHSASSASGSSVSSSTSSSSSSSSSSPVRSYATSPATGSPEMPSSPRSRTSASFAVLSSDKQTKRRSKKRGKENKAKILLADDNFDMREYVARLLSAKYEVISVSNGLEALSMLRSSPKVVDLVLTDVMMPFLDGFGLLKEIRSRDETRTLPVIMLSARAGEEASSEGLAEGADDYLIKPFTARELLSRVASHLKMARMRMEAANTEHTLRMEVHEVRERLERILASIQDAVVSLDSRLRYVFVNSNAAILLGAKKEDMIGHNVWRFMVDTEDRLVRRNLERAVKERLDLVFEYYYAARDRWYESRIYPGSDGGATIYTIDVTSRKKSEQRLSLLAQVGRLMAVSVDSHLPTLLSEAQNIIAGSLVADWSVLDLVGANGAIQRIATPHAPVNLWNIHKITPNSKVRKTPFIKEVELCNGDLVGIECALPKSDNFVLCLLQGHGKVFGTWVFTRQSFLNSNYMDEDRAVCEELARRAGMAIDNIRLYRAAESANLAKDHFLAALSHELRTPLTPALLLSESLLGEGLPPHVEENVRMIRESVELEVQLIDDLLDLTKISRNKLKLHLQEVSVHELLNRTLQIVAHEIGVKKLRVSMHLDGDFDRLTGDPARLQQVFWNIVKNAIKFTPEGGAITIRTCNYEEEEEPVVARKESGSKQTVSSPDHGVKSAHGQSPRQVTDSAVRSKRRMLRVEISDTGIGIESHVIPHLFRAFEQGDASITVRFGGLGLGLAISRSFVEMHKGRLAAFSEGKNRGATFTVHLPTLADTSARAVTPTPPSSPFTSPPAPSVEDFSSLPSALIPVPQPVASPAALQPTGSPAAQLTAPTALKVLLVEDNKSTLMIMSRLLRQKLNYNVLVASSVGDALRVADEEKGQFDLVISDIGLPDGTGLQLMVALKAKYNLPGIALSGYGMEEDVKRSKDAGFALHLTKPVHFASLSSAIHAIFHQPEHEDKAKPST